MHADESSHFLFVDRKDQKKYICFTRRRDGRFGACLTDGEHVWVKDYNDEELKEFMKKHSMKSTQDYEERLRVSYSGGSFTVCFSDANPNANVLFGGVEEHLPALNECWSKQELKELLFRMAAGHAPSDEERPSVNERKEAQRKPIDFQPRQQQSRASSQIVTRRRAGASLINPGAKRKPNATGVAFNDAEDED